MLRPLLLVICTVPLFAGAQEQLQKTVGEVLRTLDSKKPLREKRNTIAKLYYDNFDLEKMAANTLKADFNKLSPHEQKQFAQKFGKFVLEFYLTKIERYNKNKVEFVGEEAKGNRVVVKTLLEYEGKMAAVNYFMAEKDGRWLVYDFEVEGVRLSSTYRNQFASLLKKGGFSELDAELDKLLAKYSQ